MWSNWSFFFFLMISLCLAHIVLTNLLFRVKHKITASLPSMHIELRQKLLHKCLTGKSYHKELPCLLWCGAEVWISHIFLNTYCVSLAWLPLFWSSPI